MSKESEKLESNKKRREGQGRHFYFVLENGGDMFREEQEREPGKRIKKARRNSHLLAWSSEEKLDEELWCLSGLENKTISSESGEAERKLGDVTGQWERQKGS